MRTIAMLGLLAAASLLSGSASAAHNGRTTHVTTVTTVAGSAVKHHKRSHTVTSPATSGRWPDPSTGPGHDQFLAEQRAGRCVMDEGYGRWTYCDNH